MTREKVYELKRCLEQRFKDEIKNQSVHYIYLISRTAPVSIDLFGFYSSDVVSEGYRSIWIDSKCEIRSLDNIEKESIEDWLYFIMNYIIRDSYFKISFRESNKINSNFFTALIKNQCHLEIDNPFHEQYSQLLETIENILKLNEICLFCSLDKFRTVSSEDRKKIEEFRNSLTPNIIQIELSIPSQEFSYYRTKYSIEEHELHH